MRNIVTRVRNKIKREIKQRKRFEGKLEIKAVVSPEVAASYRESCHRLKNRVRIVDEFSGQTGRRYVYAPKVKALDANQMLEVCLLLIQRDLDYVVVSETLDDYPSVGGVCIEDALIHRQRYDAEHIRSDKTPLFGRLLRLPGYRVSGKTFDLSEALGQGVTLQREFELASGGCMPPAYHAYLPEKTPRKGKKLVFVVPVFMAVGGVERNTIEIMRALSDRYDFCVITLERHAKGQGSLHYQLDGLCEACFDLRELFEFENYLDTLACLKRLYAPDVVWLCNNSPWLEENMLSFRALFAQERIIAQDVYDTDYGWVEYYKNEGMQKMDGYIAVNEKIKEVFLSRYFLPEEKIRVIYSAIDGDRIRAVTGKEADREQLLEKYGLEPGKKHVALIGRMTEQKDPLRYLRMIDALPELEKDVQFLLVGDGNLSEDVDRFIAGHSLADRVKRIRFVDSTPELLTVLDGLVLTSVYEGLAIVSIEAMCIGVPVFSTDTGDLRLFLDRTGGGMIIDENRSDAECFRDWLENLETFRMCAKKHGDEILDFFSAITIAKQYEKMFER